MPLFSSLISLFQLKNPLEKQSLKLAAVHETSEFILPEGFQKTFAAQAKQAKIAVTGATYDKDDITKWARLNPNYLGLALNLYKTGGFESLWNWKKNIFVWEEFFVEILKKQKFDAIYFDMGTLVAQIPPHSFKRFFKYKKKLKIEKIKSVSFPEFLFQHTGENLTKILSKKISSYKTCNLPESFERERMTPGSLLGRVFSKLKETKPVLNEEK